MHVIESRLTFGSSIVYVPWSWCLLFLQKKNQKVFVVVLKPYNTAFFNINFCFNYLDFSPCVFLCSMCYSMLHVFFYAPCVILCSMCYSMIHVLFYAIEAGIFNGYIYVLKCANICNLNHFLKIIFLSYCLFLRLLGYF